MPRKVLNLIILVPVAVVLIVLSVANREAVSFALNPFNPKDGVLSVSAPFFVFLFVALIVGMIIGSFATWLNQGKYRKRARSEAREAVRWQAEAEKARRSDDAAASRSITPLPH
ncbi:MAG: DUF1049 domain-containing protein [Pararhizobium sp.]